MSSHRKCSRSSVPMVDVRCNSFIRLVPVLAGFLMLSAHDALAQVTELQSPQAFENAEVRQVLEQIATANSVQAPQARRLRGS